MPQNAPETIPMRSIVIVGAGAMGCLFAARLVQGVAQVTLVDVDAVRLAALNRDGITLADDAGTRTVPVRAALADAVTGPVDLVMLFTKGMHTAAAVRSIGHLAGPATHAVTLQNGLGNAEAIATVFAPDRVLIGVTDFPADLQAPTRVASHGAGHVWLGGLTTASMGAAASLAARFNASGLDTQVDAAVLVQIWEKVAFNAALNALATITGLPVGGLDTQPGRRIAAAVIGEVIATAAAHGIALDRARIDAKVSFALANHRSHKPSMLQDRAAGRATEIESINGAVVAAAAAAGVPVPVTTTLADLVRMAEPNFPPP